MLPNYFYLTNIQAHDSFIYVYSTKLSCPINIIKIRLLVYSEIKVHIFHQSTPSGQYVNARDVYSGIENKSLCYT